MLLFYVIPTIAIYFPGNSLATLQAILAFWQFGPIFVNIPFWYTIYSISTSPNPDVSYAKVFVPSTYTWAKSLDWGLLYIFQWDWILIGLCNVVPAWIAVCDVQRVTTGEVTVEKLLGSFIVVTTLTVGGGPGAAIAAVWYWRKEKLAAFEGGSGVKKVQ
jgi:hypothetical protein